MLKVAVIDYGVGNLHSLVKALEAGGAHISIQSDAASAMRADALVLPGVGAFGPAAAALAPAAAALRDRLASGFPCLGICLGMQLLFDSSEEGLGLGLGALPGRVRRLRTRLVPHMGWNQVVPTAQDPLFDALPSLHAYYANSFIAEPADPDAVIAWTEYDGERFAAAVRHQRTWGVQFHPEKSGEDGVRLIRNFLAEAAV